MGAPVRAARQRPSAGTCSRPTPLPARSEAPPKRTARPVGRTDFQHLLTQSPRPLYISIRGRTLPNSIAQLGAGAHVVPDSRPGPAGRGNAPWSSRPARHFACSAGSVAAPTGGPPPWGATSTYVPDAAVGRPAIGDRSRRSTLPRKTGRPGCDPAAHQRDEPLNRQPTSVPTVSVAFMLADPHLARPGPCPAEFLCLLDLSKELTQ